MNLQESIRADLNKLNSSSINEDEQLDEVWPALPVVAAAAAKYGPKVSKAIKDMIKAANNNKVMSYSGKSKKMKTKERADGAQPSKEELDAASKWYKDAAKTSTKKNESIVEAEADGNLTEEKVGTITNNDNPQDPEVRISGFGDMTLSQLKQNVQGKLEDLVRRGKEGEYSTASWAINEQGTLGHLLKAIADITEEMEQ